VRREPRWSRQQRLRTIHRDQLFSARSSVARLMAMSLDAHENGPRCAQISGPTVGARQRSLPSISWWQTRGWVIVLCQDRSRRRRWPKASLYKGLSPSHARPTDGHVGVCPARGCPRETRQSAPGWWVRKMSTPWVHSRERQGCPERVMTTGLLSDFC
jgi:hypothetical protein